MRQGVFVNNTPVWFDTNCLMLLINLRLGDIRQYSLSLLMHETRGVHSWHTSSHIEKMQQSLGTVQKVECLHKGNLVSIWVWALPPKKGNT